jgi:hypothetical protein
MGLPFLLLLGHGGLADGQQAFMYAQADIARSGATRAAYHSPHVFVTVGGIQRATARLDPSTKLLVDSLTITSGLQAPSTCQFTAKGFEPVVGQEVVVTLGSENSLQHEFAGQILSLHLSYVGSPANPQYEVSAIDYTWLLDRRLVLRRYTNASATAIAADLIATFTSGFTTRRVEAGLEVLDEFTCTNQRVTEALTNLAQRIGGHRYVDYLRALHLFVGVESGLTNPITLTATHPTLEALQVTRDLSQYLTRVYLEGGGVNALTELAPGETILPVDDTAWYASAGGVVVSGPQRLLYTGTYAGGAGSLVGPGIGPSAALVATSVVGAAGVESGAHNYAASFTTAAGESLPSPLTPITVGPMATPSTAPTLALAAGAGLNTGVYGYGITFGTALGETTIGVLAQITTSTQLVPPSGYWTGFYYDALPGGSMTANKFYGYVVTFTTAAGETTGSTSRVIGSTSTFDQGVRLHAVPVSNVSLVTSRKVYRTIACVDSGAANVAALHYLTTIANNTTTTLDDSASDASMSGNAAPPSSNTATYPANQVALSAIPLGPTGTTSRTVYRTTVGGATYKRLTTIADNSTTTYADATADGSLGATVPSTNTAAMNQVNLSGIPIGSATVTSRKVYRTAAGGAQFKLLTTLADNTTTTYADATADASLGADAPSSDTSGLAQPDGQINAGSTVLLVAGPGAFDPAGGWAIIGNGQQVIRYTGIAGTSLTGVPASGAGAIVASVGYNSTVTAAPTLTGIPASGAGAMIYPLKKGDPINLLVQVDDLAAQIELASLLGGDGIQEEYLQDRRLSRTEATARATARLTERNQIEVAVTFTTHDVNTIAGRTVSIDLPVPISVSGDFALQSVTITDFTPNILPRYTARASSTQFSLADLLRLGGQGTR